MLDACVRRALDTRTQFRRIQVRTGQRGIRVLNENDARTPRRCKRLRHLRLSGVGTAAGPILHRVDART